MTVATLTPRVREALGLSSDYDAEILPAAIRRTLLRLLRDYNFPKSQRRFSFNNLLLASDEFTLPAGLKRVLGVRFYAPPAQGRSAFWTDWMERRDGPVRPAVGGYAQYYWLDGQKLYTDTPVGSEWVAANVQLHLHYQSMLVADNEDWLTADFEDVIFHHVVYNFAAEIRKPEVSQAFGSLWAESQASIAIYLNELEWDGMLIMQREQFSPSLNRYPIS